MVGSVLVLAVMLQLTVLRGSSLVHTVEGRTEPPVAHFLVQDKRQCHFANGTQQVRLVARYIYDRQEVACFDSRVGRYEAVTELEEADVRLWNSEEARLRWMRGEVDRFCRSKYRVFEKSVTTRKVKPTAKISPTKADPGSPHTLLLCTVAGFYPSEIDVKWLKNGQEVAEGVGYGEELQNGDWTFQTQVLLETRPQRGDVYSCRVEHPSLKTPITVQWEPQMSDSARRKVWTGVVGALLGVAFVAVGLYFHLRNKRALNR